MALYRNAIAAYRDRKDDGFGVLFDETDLYDMIEYSVDRLKHGQMYWAHDDDIDCGGFVCWASHILAESSQARPKKRKMVRSDGSIVELSEEE